MNCFLCSKPLTGGTDTFGERGEELCWDCYAENNSIASQETWYGLGPHKHAYDADGDIIIGGTTFDPLPPHHAGEPVDFGDRTFTPDLDAPGCGVWQMKPFEGWR